MLGPRLLASVSLTSAYVLADSPDQADPYQGPSVIFLVDSLYAEAMEAVNFPAAL
jgi:hypothetical protein